jgi:hypothetical protein
MAAAMLWGLPLPLMVVQILYVNLALDALSGLALGVDWLVVSGSALTIVPVLAVVKGMKYQDWFGSMEE